MTEYLPLQKIYYAEKSSERDSLVQGEAERRLNDASTFRTGVKIEYGELFLAMPRELSLLAERLLRVERKVSQLWHELPGIAQGAYLRGLIIDEIVSTNGIESIRSTRRQIQEALESIESATPSREFRRFREFTCLYYELIDKSHIVPQTPADIRKIYDAILEGELKKEQQPDGEFFRKDPVDIVTSTQKVAHKGVVPEASIIKLLEQMISLVNSTDIPPLYTAIIAHYLFEYIHPFYDGNGITGRYLLALNLSKPLSLATVLSLSSVIADNKRRYYKAFTTTESPLNHGEMTFFVIQMMEFIRLAQDAVMENLEEKKAKLETALESLAGLKEEPYSLSRHESDIMFIAVQDYLFNAFEETSLEDISLNAKVGKQTARKRTLALEEKGLLKCISQRPLRFQLTEQALTVFGI